MTNKILSAAAILTTALAVGSSATVDGADWPCFRGPAHDGKSVETISWPKAGPRPLWRINVGIGHSAVSVVGDRAYTMGNTNDTDTVFAIDVATGKIVWKHSYPCAEKVGIKDYDGPFATPTVANGVVYTLSGRHQSVRHGRPRIRRRGVRRARCDCTTVGTGRPVQPLAHERSAGRLSLRP